MGNGTEFLYLTHFFPVSFGLAGGFNHVSWLLRQLSKSGGAVAPLKGWERPIGISRLGYLDWDLSNVGESSSTWDSEVGPWQGGRSLDAIHFLDVPSGGCRDDQRKPALHPF